MNSFARLIETFLHKNNSNFESIRLSQTSNKGDYDSVIISSEMTAYRPRIEGALFCRIKETGKQPYIAFRKKYKYWFDEKGIETWFISSDQEFFRINLREFLNAISQNEISFSQLTAQICFDAMSFPKFGCCSKYRQCSELGKCIHEDLLYSSACEYRRNLEAGRNFYKRETTLNENIAVIDIETPNRNNDSICSIGIVIIENGIISKRISHLINPETYFDDSNIAIHGITAFDVMNQPTFPTVWEEINEYFSGYLLAGHNFRFDLSCIKKVLQHYQIEASPIYYVDTLSISRCFNESTDNHQLSTLCCFYNIKLDNHHDALCDSLATAELLLKLIQDYNIDIDEFTKKYDFADYSPKRERSYCENTKALQELQGVLYGVICDGELNDSEIFFIRNWLHNHKELNGNFPYDKIYSTVEEILEDGIITNDERNRLFSLINMILNPVVESTSDICIQIEGSSICLTGEFECMSKMDLSALLENMGAIIKKNVVKSLDYLFVGNKGSEKWSQGNYGGKIKKAMEYNENGSSIAIIKEDEILPIILDE